MVLFDEPFELFECDFLQILRSDFKAFLERFESLGEDQSYLLDG